MLSKVDKLISLLNIIRVEEIHNMTKIYCIKDTDGNYGGKLNIFSNNMKTGRGDYKWSYYSTYNPMSWFECDCDNCDEINLELQNEISKLREINLLAKYDLDWMVEEFESRVRI